MPLPDLIEIVPLDKPVRAEITVPGSKSITNRALILAALADGEVTLQGALWSEDTQVMTEALQKLGFEINATPDPEEFCNRTIMVKGLGGKIPKAGTAEKPLELFVGNAGTAARFLAALVCLGNGVYRLHGVPRMHERPQAALFKALRELGYRVDSPNDKLPATIFGRSSRGNEAHSSKGNQSLLTSAATSEGLRSCTVSIEESSQFASALLLCAKVGGWQVKVTGENAEESPYVRMTLELVEAFPKNGGTFQIEPDASSGSYFCAANQLQAMTYQYYGSIEVVHWPTSDLQVDAGFPKYLPLPEIVSRSADLADSILTAFILAPFSERPVTFTDLSRIRMQESDRLEAMFYGLQATGSMPLSGVAPTPDQPYLSQQFKNYVSAEDNSLRILPAKPSGAEIDSHDDHRIAMCFAILGLKVPGIKIQNPACVKKTFPNFFQKLATPPPRGLGATILDAKTGRKLEVGELFAD